MSSTTTDPRFYYESHQWLYNWFWSKTALHYGLWLPGVKNLAEAIVMTNRVLGQKLHLTSDDHVLDLGSGTGGTAITFAKEFGCHVTGVTISPRQQKQATNNARRAGVSERVTFVVDNFDQPLNLPLNTFSAVTSVEAFCYAQDKEKTIHYIVPLLKPGARLAIDDGFLTHADLTTQEAATHDISRRGWQIDSFITRAEMENILQRTGWKHIQSANYNREIMPSARMIALRGRLFLWPAWLLTRLRILPQLFYDNARCMVAQETTFGDLTEYLIVTAERD